MSVYIGASGKGRIMGSLNKILLPGIALAVIALAFPRAVRADKTFTGEGYAITFVTGWDTLMNAGVFGKTQGFEGLATLAVAEGAVLPEADSLAEAYADSLGGALTKDSSGILTLGKYEVHWQEFTYDSIPALSEAISAQVGIPITLENGRFRVYYLTADGMVFSIAVMAVLPGGRPPYDDIEKAITTLKLGASAGIRYSAGYGALDLRIRGGRLEGSWITANKVRSVDGFDARGGHIGSGRPEADGSWILPASQGEMFLRIRAASGEAVGIRIRP